MPVNKKDWSFVIIIGQSGWSTQGSPDLVKLRETVEIPRRSTCIIAKYIRMSEKCVGGSDAGDSEGLNDTPPGSIGHIVWGRAEGGSGEVWLREAVGKG